MKNWRINFILISLIFTSVIIIGRLFYIQVINHKYWQALGQGQQRFFISLQGDRGEVFFQNNIPIAVNQKSNLIFAVPNKIKNPEKTADILSQILKIDKNLILEKFNKDSSLYEVLKKKLNEEESLQIKKIKLSGIYLKQENIRYYPFENLASHIIGFVDAENRGQYGIEGFYNNILQGKEKSFEKTKGPIGYLINEYNPLNEKGTDIVLTVDYNIQFVAEGLLKKAKEELEIEKGEIVVIDPQDGKILALANFPDFDPNQYSKISDLKIFKNSSIQEIFEPGSVFKPIVMAAALDQEKISPLTTFVDEGNVKINNSIISNFDKKKYGKRTMTEVLEKSINTGAVFVEQQLGHQLFLEYLEKFGFFEPTGIDLQGETFSQNKEFKKGYDINFATASFGQGIGITSMQLVRAISVIANGGKLINPYVVKKQIKSEKQIISQKTAAQLTGMMVSVVENGFGKKAKIPGYYIAGKTGTAQIPWSYLGINKKGYSDQTIQSFIGFGPAFSAKFLILVKLQNPKTRSGSHSAAPIFKELAKYIIDYYQIPPDYK